MYLHIDLIEPKVGKVLQRTYQKHFLLSSQQSLITFMQTSISLHHFFLFFFFISLYTHTHPLNYSLHLILTSTTYRSLWAKFTQTNCTSHTHVTCCTHVAAAAATALIKVQHSSAWRLLPLWRHPEFKVRLLSLYSLMQVKLSLCVCSCSRRPESKLDPQFMLEKYILITIILVMESGLFCTLFHMNDSNTKYIQYIRDRVVAVVLSFSRACSPYPVDRSRVREERFCAEYCSGQVGLWDHPVGDLLQWRSSTEREETHWGLSWHV